MRNTRRVVPTRLPLLSRTAEHALRAILYLGMNSHRGRIPAAEMANALGAPPNYLSKTLQLLARRGLLLSSRGPAGGFQLAVDPERMTAASVVEAVEDAAPSSTCLLGDRPCDVDHPCPAHERWTELTERVREPMERTTIADLLGRTAETIEPKG